MTHPEVLRAYQTASYEYVEKSDDQNETKFYQLVTWGADARTPVQPLQHSITKIVRVKPGLEEFVYYNDEMVGYDMMENRHNYTKCVGRYEMPIFRKEYDSVTKRSVGREVVAHEIKYDIPYTKEKIRELLAQAKEGQFYMYVLAGGRKYEIFSQDDFAEGTFEELVRMGKDGKSLWEVRNPNATRPPTTTANANTSTVTNNSNNNQQQPRASNTTKTKD